MRYLFLLCSIAVLLFVGCNGSTSNGTNPPVPAAVFTATGAGLFDGEPARINLTIANGTAPFTVEIDMDGGAEDVPAGTAVDADSIHDFNLVEGGPYTWTVTVTDSRGETGSATGDYGPVGTAVNHAPAITDIAFTDGVLAVSVDDPEGDDPVTVSVAEYPGLLIDTSSQQVANQSTALFTFKLIDPYYLDTELLHVTASDGKLQGTATVAPTGDIEQIEVPDHSLAAIPLLTTVEVGEPVDIVIVCGDLPADQPLNYLNSVSLDGITDVIEGWPDFDYGAIGGGKEVVDGIWTTTDPVPTSFFTSDFIMHEQFWLMDMVGYGVMPVGGGETTTGGTLICFQTMFTEPGTFELGFVQFQDVKRTYYSDNEAIEYYFGDVSNDYTGLPNTITVVAAGN